MESMKKHGIVGMWYMRRWEQKEKLWNTKPSFHPCIPTSQPRPCKRWWPAVHSEFGYWCSWTTFHGALAGITWSSIVQFLSLSELFHLVVHFRNYDFWRWKVKNSTIKNTVGCLLIWGAALNTFYKIILSNPTNHSIRYSYRIL